MIHYQYQQYDSRIVEMLKAGMNQVEIVAELLGTTESKRQNKEVELLRRYISRHRKRFDGMFEGIVNATDRLDVDNKDVKHLWMKDKGASLFIKNPNYEEPVKQDFEKLKQLILDDVKSHSFKIDVPKRTKNKDSHLLVIDPADVHIGKLCSAFETGEDYNAQIAVKRVLDGVQGILDKCQGFHIDKIVFVGGNDILHIDSPRNTTTSGTHQDTHMMWYDSFNIARKLYVEVLTILLSVADVEFIYNPSNHDYVHGFFLCQIIESHFAKCKNITFMCDMSHRKYTTYGNNLIGTTHGDGAKVANLPLLMAHEAKEWSNCKHKYIYTHHIHHKASKDYMGVCVESLRSPSSTDSWHAKNGFMHAPKAIEGYLHHKLHGQVARLTNLF